MGGGIFSDLTIRRNTKAKLIRYKTAKRHWANLI